jgi:RNA polymerase sigma factor (sigma-70 family)
VKEDRSDSRPLTAAEQARVEEALPEAQKLARLLAWRCPGIELEELIALGRAVLAANVRSFDPTRGPSLAQYAYKAMRGAMLRASRKQARDPLSAAWVAALTHEEALEDKRDLAFEIAETDAERSTRSHALGEDVAAVAFYAYKGHKWQSSPEDELGDHEERSLVRDAVSDLGEDNAALLELLYWQDLDWEATAERLGLSVSSAQRLENKLIPRLRAALKAKGVQGASPSGD